MEVLGTPAGMRPGGIAFARHDDIPGATLARLTNHPSFPMSPSSVSELTDAEIPRRDGDWYGAVMRGYLLPPVTGTYVFAIAGDDASELRLGTDTSPASARRIAFSNQATEPRRWTQFPSQRSVQISLEAGRAYYLEARMKEAEGDDHLAVAWQSPAAGVTSFQVIPGRFLAPHEMNFAPEITPQSLRLHRDAFTGARFGRIEATDRNAGEVLTLELVSANPAGLVRLDAADGWLRVADGEALLTTTDDEIALNVRITDSGGLSTTGLMTCELLAPSALGTARPLAEIFTNLSGATSINGLTNHPRYPGQPDALRPVSGLVLGRNIGRNYGSRMRAQLVVPSSGSYRFHIASDDSSELWLGTGPEPETARLVARVSGAVLPEQWNAQAGQRSAAIALTANRRYYIETRHKQGGGEDHLAVAWTRPGTATPELIPEGAFTPVDIGHPPAVGAALEATVSAGAPAGTVVATLEARDSRLDLLAWRITGGDAEGLFAVDADSGTVSVANAAALRGSSQALWTLDLEVQDSGYGDLFPRKTTPTTLTVRKIGGGSPYELWATASGIGGAPPEDDSDWDGLPNLLEFAFGGNPEADDARAVGPRISLAPEGPRTRVLVTHRRHRDASAAGLDYTVAIRDTLLDGGWVPASTDQELALVPSDLPPGFEEVTWRLEEPVPEGDVARWVRVEVRLLAE